MSKETDTTLDAIDSDPVHRVRLNPSEADLSLAKAQKIADRTRKQGLEGGYKVWLDTEVEVRKDALGREHKVVWKVLCWEGEPVRLPGGWKFIAVVEWLGDTPITRTMPGYEGEMIDREWIAESYCDHCQTKRRRKHVVVVEDAEGTRKRVGSTCCRDYLGWDFRPTFLPDPSDSDDDFGGGAVPWTISTHYLLTLAAMMARGFGWVSAANARDHGGASTADLVRQYLFGRGKSLEGLLKEMRERGVEPSEQDDLDVERALAWVAEQKPDSEYIANLQAALAQETTRTKEIGIVVSAVPVALKALDRKAEQAAAAKAEGLVEEQFAPDKTRVTVTVKCVGVTAWDGDYGTTYNHTFVGEGHRFQWKTGTQCLNKGEEYTLTGTVKESREWEGKVYTVLTRCKIN